MELTKQCVSLDLAKRLKELGVKQESQFKWTNWHNGVLTFGKPAEDFRGEWHIVTTPCWNDETIVSAFTVAELGEMLPNQAKIHNGEIGDLQISKAPKDRWEICYMAEQDFRSEYADTEADARAKILIYLIENDLYKPTH